MPIPHRFQPDNGECEHCGVNLENGGITVMYKGNPIRLCVECAGRRFEEMVVNVKR